MTDLLQIPPAPESGVRLRGASASAVAADRTATTVRAMSGKTTRETLRDQDWGRIRARVAAFAWVRTGRRSWELANDLAQDAITDAFDHGGWEPEKGPLIDFLMKRVATLESTYRRRKRTTFEVRMIEAPQYRKVASNDEPTDEVLDRQRLAEAFRKRLGERLAHDEDATTLIALMMEDITSPAAMVRASGFSLERVRTARRRLFYQAQQVSNELSMELDAREDEVTP